MSKQANPAAIGSFVLGGLALLVIFVLIIAGGSFLKDERRYVIYFDGTIYGLKVGSNVMFRGVPIGYVSDIDVVSDFQTLEFEVPVYINIIPDSIKTVDPESGLVEDNEGTTLGELVKLGLRASLRSESLITGQLYIELDFHPNDPPVYHAKAADDYPEIPSIPSDIQEVIAKAQRFVSDLQSNIDVPKLAADIARIVAGLDQFVNSDETQRLTAQANLTLTELRTTLDNLNAALNSVDSEIDPVAESLVAALDKAESVLSLAETQLRDDSDIAYRLGMTLKEIEAAARAVRMLADQLEEQPESLLRGKQ